MPARERAKAKKCASSILASFPVSPCLAVTEVCPYCQEAHSSEAEMMGVWDNLEKLPFIIIYFLCRPCTRRFEASNLDERQRMAKRIESNLEAMGAFIRLEREGLGA